MSQLSQHLKSNSIETRRHTAGGLGVGHHRPAGDDGRGVGGNLREGGGAEDALPAQHAGPLPEEDHRRPDHDLQASCCYDWAGE